MNEKKGGILAIGESTPADKIRLVHIIVGFKIHFERHIGSKHFDLICKRNISRTCILSSLVNTYYIKKEQHGAFFIFGIFVKVLYVVCFCTFLLSELDWSGGRQCHTD